MKSNVDLVIDFYNAFNGCDLAAFDEILSTDWINHPADPGYNNTPAGFKNGVRDFHSAFEGFNLTRNALISQGDLVVCRITMTGKHVGLLGIWSPDNKKKTFYGMDMHRIFMGRIAETWHFERLEG